MIMWADDVRTPEGFHNYDPQIPARNNPKGLKPKQMRVQRFKRLCLVFAIDQQ